MCFSPLGPAAMRQVHWEMKLIIIKCTENQHIYVYIYIFSPQLLIGIQAHSRCSINTFLNKWRIRLEFRKRTESGKQCAFFPPCSANILFGPEKIKVILDLILGSASPFAKGASWIRWSPRHLLALTVNHCTVLFFGDSTCLALFFPLRGNLIPVCYC